MKESVYSFETLFDALEFFKESNVDLTKVFIGGEHGGANPTEDDSPVFIWHD